MAFEQIKFHIPDQDQQFAEWMAVRGEDWLKRLMAFMTTEDNGKVINWTPERYYELAYLWNEKNHTSVQITRYWIGRGLLALRVTRRAPDGTGHRGVVDGMARRMQDEGILVRRGKYPDDRVRNAIQGKSMSTSDEPVRVSRPARSMREIIEMRRRRLNQSGGPFDSLSREERGLPAAELANIQHPDHALGVTYDIAFRNERGRTHIFTADEKKRLDTFSGLSDLVRTLAKLSETELPTHDEFAALRSSEQDLILHSIAKMLPGIRKLLDHLEGLKAMPRSLTFAMRENLPLEHEE